MRYMTRLAMAILSILVACAAAIPPSAAHAQSDSLILGIGLLTDSSTKNTYNINLLANEESDPGSGKVTLIITGPALSVCSIRASAAELTGSSGSGDYYGNYPFESIQCGTASGLSVDIKNCLAKVTVHGYVHADHPFPPYVGVTTIDVEVQKGVGKEDGNVNVTVHSPKSKIRLHGPCISCHDYVNLQ